MEDLPLVPAMKIIGYLSIEEISKLKLVNKWFYQLINENVKIENLVISTYDDLPYNRRWFYTYDLVSLQQLIENKSFRQTSLLLKQSIISNQLKRLYIYEAQILLEVLNSFDKLIHLEMIDFAVESITRNNVLRLPMLEILYLEWSNEFGLENLLVIDLPKLRRFKLQSSCIHGSFMELTHPDSIQCLEVNSFDECRNFLSFCINLQHFYCANLYLDNLNNFIKPVRKLTKLRSIHLNGEKDVYAILELKKESFNKDLKIHFGNLEIGVLPDELDFDNWSILDHKMINLYAKYYSKLADYCPHVSEINYNDLEACFNKLPDNFTNKFPNFDFLVAHKEVNNLNQLIKVLDECKTIRKLKLHSSLGQRFFDCNLTDLCPNIVKLKVLGNQVLDFEFVFKFKNICRISIDQTLPIELAKRLIQSFKSLKRLEFYHRDVFEIHITNYCNLYLLRERKTNTRCELKNNTLDSLLDNLEKFCDQFQ